MSALAQARVPFPRLGIWQAVRRGVRRVPRAGWICALVATINALGWSLITPPMQVPDEPAHIYYVQQLAETGQVPDTGGDGTYSLQDLTLRDVSRLDDINTSFLGRPAWTSDEGRAALRALRSQSPVGGGGDGGVGQYPPLYYATLAVPYAVTGAVGGSLFEQVMAMRALSALYAGAAVLFVFLFLQELLPRAPWAWRAGALACALQPLFAFDSGGVNPDSMLSMFAAAAFYLIARAFRRGLTPGVAVALGATLALAVLAKLAAIGLLPGAVVVALLLIWRAGPGHRRETLRAAGAGALAFAAPMLLYVLLGAAIWDRPVPFFGGGGSAGGVGAPSDPAPTAPATTPSSLTGQLTYTWQLLFPRLSFMYDWLPGFLPNDVWFRGWIGRFGWGGIIFDPFVYTWALRAYALVAALVVVSLVRLRRSLRRHLAELIGYLAVGLGLIAFYGYVGYHYLLDTTFTFEQARYLFPLLALYGGAVAMAVAGLGRRLGAAVGATLVVFALAHDVAAIMLNVGRFYA